MQSIKIDSDLLAFLKLINAKENNKKLIPIEWAEEIRDYNQNICVENERLETKNNIILKTLKNLLSVANYDWNIIPEYIEAKKIIEKYG